MQQAVIVEQAIEFEWRDGLMYVRSGLGDRAMRWHTFLSTFQNASKAMQDYYARGAEIIEFPDRASGRHG